MAAKGVEIYLLTATRGEAGFKEENPIYEKSELGKVREEELRCTCKVLGIQPPICLAYTDGHSDHIAIGHFTKKAFWKTDIPKI